VFGYVSRKYALIHDVIHGLYRARGIVVQTAVSAADLTDHGILMEGHYFKIVILGTCCSCETQFLIEFAYGNVRFIECGGGMGLRLSGIQSSTLSCK
jgi:hypothetical protein